MENLYKRYRELEIDGEWIGLSEEKDSEPYFCTPIGAEIIGWDNGIHYCFIEDFGDMVFCVNPETCCDYNVYPIAKNFHDFLRLIAAAGNTNTLQQVILWDRKGYEDFIASPEEREYANRAEVTAELDKIRKELDIVPMENPFEYIKQLQSGFAYEKIRFSNDYYDTLGLDRPDGTVPEAKSCDFEDSVISVYKNQPELG